MNDLNVQMSNFENLEKSKELFISDILWDFVFDFRGWLVHVQILLIKI